MVPDGGHGRTSQGYDYESFTGKVVRCGHSASHGSRIAVSLALFYAGSGAAKLAGVKQLKREFAKWDYSPNLWILIGATQLTMAGPLLSRRTAFLSATGLTAFMWLLRDLLEGLISNARKPV